ncbi:DUF2188 domain-containing protein [uncultured Rhodospira sp.]|uniref:DUF2188 domain-containing protein n=1 Tax=uncultured Rhodospira sp. TaxID=1936189 RepID=UPI002635BDFE|nr:DUF2188 domain-containing protein [uncultured Rhodospira sp.]
MTAKAHHVAPRGSKWSVRRTGAARASKLFDTREQAVERGRELARRDKSELYIHGTDGLIRERLSFNGDASARKG